jgi:hypothetical protein
MVLLNKQNVNVEGVHWKADVTSLDGGSTFYN